MSTHNVRLEVMHFLENKIDGFVDQYLIPVEKIWQPSDFLPNSEEDNFFEEVKELREIFGLLLWVIPLPKRHCQPMNPG
jgi:acyl-[acyl-carrier-protein] desaturase